MSNLAQRLLFAAAAIPLTMWLLWVGPLGRNFLLAFIAAVGAWEWAAIVRAKLGGPGFSAPSALLSLAFVAGVLYPECIPSAAFVAGLTIALVIAYGFSKVAIENLLPWMVLQAAGPLYLGLWMSNSVGLFDSRPGFAGAGAFLALMFGIWANDSGAYFAGRALGKHKMAPSISPAKSWEGFFGGLLAAMIVVSTLGRLLAPQWSISVALLIAVVLSIAGPVGDLLESALKRWAGVKDSSHIFPGHGGVLDRFDSFLLAGPFAVLVLTAIGEI